MHDVIRSDEGAIAPSRRNVARGSGPAAGELVWQRFDAGKAGAYRRLVAPQEECVSCSSASHLIACGETGYRLHRLGMRADQRFEDGGHDCNFGTAKACGRIERTRLHPEKIIQHSEVSLWRAA